MSTSKLKLSLILLVCATGVRANAAPPARPAAAAPAVAAAPVSTPAAEKPSSGNEMTMEQAVQIALQRNREVIAARLEIEAAQLDRVAAGVYWNPVFSYAAGNFI